VLNKIDLLAEPPLFAVTDERIVRVFRVSAATGEGLEELKRSLFELCQAESEPAAAPLEEQPLVDFLVYRPLPRRRAYRILRTDRGFRVAGRPPERGELEAALEAAGARKGDEVEVAGEVLEWQ
jgi:hypothetical protein